MGSLIDDLRHAVRQVHRAPGFAVTAILTLAIGIGVNAVAFTVVNGVLFRGTLARGLPGVGRILTTPGGDEEGNASLAELARFREATAGRLDLAAEGRSVVAWRHDNTTETAWALYVTPNYFDLVHAPARAGTLRVERASGGPPTVVIGERFWRDGLHSPALAGLTLRLNDRDVVVSGVMAETFTGPAGIYSPDVWLPLDDLALFGASPSLERRDTRWLFVLGRLQPQVDPAEVQGRLDTAVTDMAREWPDTHTRRGATFRMLDRGNAEVRGLRTGSAIAMGIIGLVLLLACFNVANLLLARAVERERELGVRSALGAHPWQLARLVLVEGLVVAVPAGAAALVVAWWTRVLIGSLAVPIDHPQFLDLTPDGRVVLFVAALVVLAALLPGLLPAVSAARVDTLRVLGSHGGGVSAVRPARARRALVALQIGGSTVFLVLAGLLVQSYAHLRVVDLGFDRDRLVVADLDPTSYGLGEDEARQYVERLSAQALALPGASKAALVDRAPFYIGFERRSMVWPAEGSCEPGTCPTYPVHAVTADYFDTLGIPLVEGRSFLATDAADAVVVTRAFARRHWPDAAAVGRTFRLGDGGVPVRLVGVIADSHTRGLDRPESSIFRLLTPTELSGPLSLVVRTSVAPALLVRPLHAAALGIDPDVPPAIKTMADRAAVQLWPFRIVSTMLATCGALALVLAVVGLGSVVRHSVSRRLREFGVRVSMGATRADLMRHVLQSGLALLGPGLGVGLLAAAGLARLGRSMILGVDVMSPTTYIVIAGVQLVVTVVACVGPALTAARTNPLAALRAD